MRLLEALKRRLADPWCAPLHRGTPGGLMRLLEALRERSLADPWCALQLLEALRGSQLSIGAHRGGRMLNLFCGFNC